MVLKYKKKSNFLRRRRQATNMKSKIHLQTEFQVDKSGKGPPTQEKIYDEFFFLVCLTNRKIPPEREKESQPLEPISHGV